MIYLDEQNENRTQFENLLQRTKDSVLEQLSQIDKPSLLTGADFELIVYENAVLQAKQTEFEGKLIHTADREFPDIIATGRFGIEVKATKKDDWTSIGNSVLESSRIVTVEKIYMFFGKLGGTPDIIFRDYEDCLKGISVTHYPRYTIDMKMEQQNSIFKKMNTDYDTIRKSSSPVTAIRAYYKSLMKEGDALWWIGDDAEDMPNLSPIIKNFSSLDKATKDTIEADMFAYFPELLLDGTKKYERVPAFLASQHGVVSASVRDIFSAGGQVNVTYENESFRVPQVMGELLRLAPKIRKCLENKNEVQLSNYWQKHIENFTTAEDAWVREVDSNTLHMGLRVKASYLYLAAFDNRSN
ncbi:MAG: hypothetical protein ACOH18_02860 [Candidatus Saccharimonadaceae bacterium]